MHNYNAAPYSGYSKVKTRNKADVINFVISTRNNIKLDGNK